MRCCSFTPRAYDPLNNVEHKLMAERMQIVSRRHDDDDGDDDGDHLAHPPVRTSRSVSSASPTAPRHSLTPRLLQAQQWAIDARVQQQSSGRERERQADMRRQADELHLPTIEHDLRRTKGIQLYTRQLAPP